MSFLQRFYPESTFGGYSDRDGTVAFYGRIQSMLTPDMTVLDVGCGRGAGLVDDPVRWRRELRRMRGKCRMVIGIDVDPVGVENPGLDEFRLLEGAGGGGSGRLTMPPSTSSSQILCLNTSTSRQSILQRRIGF